MNQQIWQWTLTKEAIAPCFVRDVLAMRQPTDRGADFFWLGHTPCRTVLLVGMVVAIQVYDKRAIYTIDDGTAVIDCVLRHPQPTLPAPAPRSPPRATGGPGISTSKRPSPKKPRLDKARLESTEPPPPITEPGYPVRVVGRVARHYQSKQIHAETIDPCPSSLDEIAHLERVIELHKTKYSLSVPFVPPPKPTPCTPLIDTSTDPDASVFSNTSLPSRPGPSTNGYTLHPPPPMPMPLQNRNRPPSAPAHLHSAYQDHTHAPSSPTASSIASSTPSSPCKPSSPVKAHESPRRLKLRHPSRLHTRDLTANTFRIYVKHYMDNAPPPFFISLSCPPRGVVTTPTKHARDEAEGDDEPTPRPRLSARNESRDSEGDEDEDGPTLGFTLSHLRRVPELALLAARVVRAEARKRDKADREKDRGSSHSRIPSSTSVPPRPNGRREGHGNRSTSTPRTGAAADPPCKKIKRLFSWAVVKLHEEGSIVLWDGDVRPLPVPPPPPPDLEGVGGGNLDRSGLWKEDDTRNTFGDPSVSCSRSHASCTSASVSVLYASSASASLYSHYHAPREPHRGDNDGRDVLVRDADADPGYVSDPGVDEEAYVPLTARLFAGYVSEAMGALRRGPQGGGRGGRVGGGVKEPTPEDILAYLRRTDGRWARVGVWAVQEALAVLKTR